MNIILISLMLVSFISTPVIANVFYKKGVEKGRNQILEENLIRLKNDLYRIEIENSDNELLKKFAYLTEGK